MKPSDFDAALKKLAEIVTLAQATILFDIEHDPNLSLRHTADHDLPRVLAELRFLKTVPGFSIGDNVNILETLEERSSRLGV